MRRRKNTQEELRLQQASLSVTEAYFSRYDRIDTLLDAAPKVLDAVHRELRKPLRGAKRRGPQGSWCRFSSDTVLRILIVKMVENLSLRDAVIRVDDSQRLRWFTRVFNRRMMDFSTLCTLSKAIRPRTWQKVNRLLAEVAADEGWIDGSKLRIDTTAVETDIHWPTDSGLLWDTYRVLARNVRAIREIVPGLLSNRYLKERKAKRLHAAIGRLTNNSARQREARKRHYEHLIALVEGILEILPEWVKRARRHARRTSVMDAAVIESAIEELERYAKLGHRVVEQARRRVLQGEQVPNEEKLFSIFEPHTELLKRGKAGKPVEFGHMVAIQQVEEKFITGYEVFEKRPADHALVDGALEEHERLFGSMPDVFTADKGFWESPRRRADLGAQIKLVSIAKKGKRTQAEEAREHTDEFREAQRFRAGVEGPISYLKRVLGMWRCMNKGFDHFQSTVGATVFAHNLLILARGYG